ncbi:AAA family ATPase [Methylomonas sp. HYX-M1]|uniref:AAA family ATPase n=1 Tax=Methylomonas sp. HYX-M1 TaxID=3139307 RepID=UPI00345C0CF6
MPETEQTLNQISQDIEKIQTAVQQALPEHSSWPRAMHQFDDDSRYALRTALATGRPLLLRGEPGVGKSQLARAAAYALDRLFVYQVIDAHTESQDLLWRFDAVARLSEAQALQGVVAKNRQKVLDVMRFISPGPVWWAFDWEDAGKVYSNSQYRLSKPEQLERKNWQPTGSVLLIDEIDKANLELPNALLELLGNNALHIPHLNKTIGLKTATPPLVMITTNEERELPLAFVRRCLVLHLDLPKDQSAFVDCLVARAQLHFEKACSKDIYQSAAELVFRERERAQEKGLIYKPGQAEYLDLVKAIIVLGKNDRKQHKTMLDSVSKFTLHKYPQMLGD